MSSSDRSALRFLRWFAAAAVLLAALLLAATWALDPLGLLRESQPGGLCRPGIRTTEQLEIKLLVAAVHQPREILLGSSRAQGGFDEALATRRLGRPVANLGLNGATLDEIDLMVREAIDRAPIDRVWIGLDFGAFVQSSARRRPWRAVPRLAPRALAWREGLLSPHALRATISALARPSLCGEPPLTPLGFLTPREPAEDTRYAPLSARARAHLLDGIAATPAARRSLQRARLDQLARLAADLRARNVRLILYLSPSSAEYRDILRAQDLEQGYLDWRSDVIALTARTGVTLLRADDPAWLIAAARRCAGPDRSEQCLFHDALHFRPALGAAIVEAALSGAAGPGRVGRPALIGGSPRR